MEILWIVLAVFIIAFIIITSSFFSAKIAQMKLRRRAWGVVGFLLGPIGLIVVCYLPSRRGDGAETNPIRYIMHSLPQMSRRTLWILLGAFGAVIVALYLMSAIPRYMENRAYEKSIGVKVQDSLHYLTSVSGTPQYIAAERGISYVITDKNELYGWGYSPLTAAQSEAGALASDAKEICTVGGKTYLLHRDGTLQVSGDNNFTTFFENVSAVRSGGDFGFLIKETGDLYMWGKNANAQLGTGDTQTVEKPMWLMNGVKDVQCGVRHSVILKKNGDVFVCGSNVNGALGLVGKAQAVKPEKLCDGANAVAAGQDFTLVLKKDGTLLSCGANIHGQLGRDTEETAANTLGPVAEKVAKIGAGGQSAFLITDENKLMCWGLGNCGQLGLGSAKDQNTPVEAAANIAEASQSGEHLLAITVDGKVLASGENRYGQMGRLRVTYTTPTAIATFKK